MASFNYITKEGDRLDLLAYKFYGGAHGITIITEANPGIPIMASYPVDTVLIIPILDDTELEDNSNLPPWKQ